MDGLDILHCVADGSEVLPESLLRDNDRASAVVGMEGERGGILETAVEEENDMMVSIIDESERTDRTGFESQIAHHPFGRIIRSGEANDSLPGAFLPCETRISLSQCSIS